MWVYVNLTVQLLAILTYGVCLLTGRAASAGPVVLVLNLLGAAGSMLTLSLASKEPNEVQPKDIQPRTELATFRLSPAPLPPAAKEEPALLTQPKPERERVAIPAVPHTRPKGDWFSGVQERVSGAFSLHMPANRVRRAPPPPPVEALGRFGTTPPATPSPSSAPAPKSERPLTAAGPIDAKRATPPRARESEVPTAPVQAPTSVNEAPTKNSVAPPARERDLNVRNTDEVAPVGKSSYFEKPTVETPAVGAPRVDSPPRGKPAASGPARPVPGDERVQIPPSTDPHERPTATVQRPDFKSKR